ncbi:MAG: Zn-ribbon containing protein [Nanoarchaeota archaeon]|nr:Zn-ribbon containing protein [Nanoarchaeota archaeon]
MPYKCIHCSEIYEDGSKEILTGCNKCKSKFFFYIKKEKLQEILANKNKAPELSAEEKDQIEQDVREMVGLEEDSETPVFLDFESVRVIKPGKYLLDLTKLFSMNKLRIYQLEDGKYIVDLSNKGESE